MIIILVIGLVLFLIYIIVKLTKKSCTLKYREKLTVSSLNNFKCIVYLQDIMVDQWAVYGTTFISLFDAYPGKITFIVSSHFFNTIFNSNNFFKKHLFILNDLASWVANWSACYNGEELPPQLQKDLDNMIKIGQNPSFNIIGYYLSDEPISQFSPFTVCNGVDKYTDVSLLNPANAFVAPKSVPPSGFGDSLLISYGTDFPTPSQGHTRVGCWYNSEESKWTIQNLSCDDAAIKCIGNSSVDPSLCFCKGQLRNQYTNNCLTVSLLGNGDSVLNEGQCNNDTSSIWSFPIFTGQPDQYNMMTNPMAGTIVHNENIYLGSTTAGGTSGLALSTKDNTCSWFTPIYPNYLSLVYKYMKSHDPDRLVCLADTAYFIQKIYELGSGECYNEECCDSYQNGIFPLRDIPYDVLLIDEYDNNFEDQKIRFKFFQQIGLLNKPWIGVINMQLPDYTYIAYYNNFYTTMPSIGIPPPIGAGFWGILPVSAAFPDSPANDPAKANALKSLLDLVNGK